MFKNIEIKNKQLKFDRLQSQRLGIYVYGLVDPRDKKVFYVGQGQDDRIFDHFKEAKLVINEKNKPTNKTLRIIDIWLSEEEVEWVIFSHGLTQNIVNHIESSLINSFSVSQNGQTLNGNSGPKSSMLSREEVKSLGAEEILPASPYASVFIFPVHNALKESSKNVYEATRAAWKITKKFQYKNSYAVGLQNGISIGSYKVQSWVDYDDKQAFIGNDYEDLLNFNWKRVLEPAMGYWQRGNHLIVEFNGAGSFRFLYGCSNKEWIELASPNKP